MKSNVDNPFQATQAEITTQTDVTASRAINDTPYQNTTAKPIMCVLSVSMPQGGLCVCKSDVNAFPSAILASISNANLLAVLAVASFWVLPGNHYRVAGSGGSTLSYWIEYT